MLKNQSQSASYLSLDWPGKPENLQACSTLISGGASTGDYAEYNLASHVGDDPSAVKANRAKLVEDLGLRSEPVWLDQVHSNTVVRVDNKLVPTASHAAVQTALHAKFQADASVSSDKDVVCAVLTADCLPVFFCDQAGTEVAVVHAGWRGLHAGIISNTINQMQSSAETLLVYFGPAIGPQAFEVGEEVLQAFVEKDQKNESAFSATETGRYLCDIYQLARIELLSSGVPDQQICGGGYCTFSESNRFYSFRRQKNTGRMANLIWLS